MPPISRRLLLAALLLCSGTALADGYRHHHHRGHSHGSFSFYFGPSWYASPFPPPAVYYPPRVIVVPPPQPPVYIEQAPAYGSSQYWYFCQSANAYYPQVGDCPGGWIRVPPRP